MKQDQVSQEDHCYQVEGTRNEKKYFELEKDRFFKNLGLNLF